MAKPGIKPSSKGTPPTPSTPSPVVGNNTSKPAAGEKVPMNFRVAAETKREIKSFAVAHDMDMRDVILEAWEMYKAAKGQG